MKKDSRNETKKRITQLPRHARARLKTFIENLGQKNKSPHTIKSYENDLLQFLEWHVARSKSPIEKIGPNNISEYLSFLSNGGSFKIRTNLSTKIFHFGLSIFGIFLFWKKGLGSPPKKNHLIRQRPLGVSSKKRHLSVIKNFFEFLQQYYEGKSKKFRFNPVKDKIHGIKLKDIDINHTSPLRPNHWEIICDTLYRVEDKFLVTLLYFGGLRLTEVQLLNIEDFDQLGNIIHLKRKGGYKHALKIQNAKKIFDLLDLYLVKSKRGLTGPLFLSKNGQRTTNKTIYNRVMSILKKCGLPSELTPHSFRRACATNLYLQTRDLLLVRDYLNHQDAKVTQTYIDSSQIKDIQEIIPPELDFERLHQKSQAMDKFT